MGLVKHTPGKLLTPAELKQRRDAARARWGIAVGATGLGAGVGGVLSARQVVGAIPQDTANALAAADERVVAGHERRLRQIRQAVHVRSLSVRTRPTAPPPIGSVRSGQTHGLIYDYEIDRLERQLKRVPDAAKAAIRRRITELQRLKTNRPQAIGRQATSRVVTRKAAKQLKNTAELTELFPDVEFEPGAIDADLAHLQQQASKPPVQVTAHVERRFHGGDTLKRLGQRITEAKKALNARRVAIERLLERRTAAVREMVRQQAVRDVEAAIQQRLVHAGGRGAAIGAGVGLTAAGIGIIAEHVARAWHEAHLGRRARLDSDLAKAAPQTPEDQMSLGLAGTFRQWIDRLLGREGAADPVGLGDGIAAAMAPGLVSAYADGLANPPVDTEGLPPQRRVAFAFDVLNPAVRRHMAEYALDRIREITDKQREAIRTAIMEGSVLQGINPNEVARTIRLSIGLTAYQQSVVQSFRTGLQQLDPRVLERKLRDQRYDRTVRKAIETNTPLTDDQVEAMTNAYHRRMLALRARTIARTEALRATSYGGLARAQQVLDEHPDLDVIKAWLATDDERTRDTHRDLNGRRVEGMTTNFVTSHGNLIRWPLDDTAVAEEVINCRCTLQFIFVPRRGQLVSAAA